jgi:hypothetical protein
MGAFGTHITVPAGFDECAMCFEGLQRAALGRHVVLALCEAGFEPAPLLAPQLLPAIRLGARGRLLRVMQLLIAPFLGGSLLYAICRLV